VTTGWWRSLRARLVVSHLLVALVAGLVTVLVVRLVAVSRWDMMSGEQGQHGAGPAMGGAGAGFRTQFVDSVDQAVLAGVSVGLAVAVVLGVAAARRTARPLEQLRTATDQLALGRYDVRVPTPSTTELAALADDVRRLADRLERTETRRARLIGEVAHEMRTPLTVTRGYAEAMLDGVLPADESVLQKVVDQTRRLERLAEDLSSLSQAEEGRLPVRLVPADLVQTVQEAVDAVGERGPGRGVRLRVEAPSSVPLEHDPDRVAQVVTNLLSNAVRASAAGGEVLVRVVPPTGGPAQGAAQGGGDARVEVVDQGVGLRPGEETAVFERFYRGPADNATEGSGIGLTIARALARGHGGDLVATSEGPGRGARFTLRLPTRHEDGPAAG
jgi:histidine kinase